MLNNAPEDIYVRLKTIVKRSSYVYFNAICGEVLWNHFHNKSFANIALNSYFHELTKPSLINKYHFVQMYLSICRVYSRYKSKNFNYALFCDSALTYVSDHLDDFGYCPLFIIESLLKCNECISEIENTLKSSIDYFQNIKDYRKCIDYMKCLLKHYKGKKRKKDIEYIQCEIAKEYEKFADTFDWTDPSNAHIIISNIHHAMAEWNQANVDQSKAERQRLAKRIQPIKLLFLEKMQYLKSTPIDISTSIEYKKQ